MNLNKLYLTNNNCYKVNKTISIKGMMVHVPCVVTTTDNFLDTKDSSIDTLTIIH
jgi:hypothetical protein